MPPHLSVTLIGMTCLRARHLRPGARDLIRIAVSPSCYFQRALAVVCPTKQLLRLAARSDEERDFWR